MKRYGDGITKRVKGNIQINVSYIHYNDAGENETFERLDKQERIGVKFEYTAPGTQMQRNFPVFLRNGLWTRQQTLPCCRNII